MTAWPEGEGEGRGANNVISNTWYLIPHWPSVVYRGISTSVHHYIRQFTCQLTTLSVSLSVTWLFYLSLDHFIRHLTTYSYFLCPFLHICRQLFALKKWSSPFYLSCTWTMGGFQKTVRKLFPVPKIPLRGGEGDTSHHSCKKCFCLRDPVFWGGIFLILMMNFPNLEEDFPNIEEKFS